MRLMIPQYEKKIKKSHMEMKGIWILNQDPCTNITRCSEDGKI